MNFCFYFFAVFVILTARSDNCAFNQYFDGSTCSSCDSSCGSCLSANASSCTSCSSTTFLLNGTCVTSCPTGYTVNNAQNTCDGCFRNCAQCANGYSKFENFCVQLCPQGTAADNSTGVLACRLLNRVSAPLVLIRDSNLGYINIAKDLLVDIEIVSKAPYTASWTANSSSLLSGVTMDQAKIVIPKANLITGRSFLLTATYVNQAGSVQQSITFNTVNSATLGQIQITPNQPVAMDTQINISLSGFQGDVAFLVDIIAVQDQILAQDYSDLRYISTNISDNGVTTNIFYPVLLAKGIQNDPNGISVTTYFPPILNSATYKIIAIFYNLYQTTQMVNTISVIVQEAQNLASYSVNNLKDAYFAARLMRIYLNSTLTFKCYQSANVLQYAAFYGNLACPSQYCNENGNCSYNGSRPVCSCTAGYEGLCCQISSNNSAYSSINLISDITQLINKTSITAQTYGSLALILVELSYLTNFMNSETLIAVANTFSSLLQYENFFTFYLAGELYTAWAQIRALSQDILSDEIWKFEQENYYMIQNALNKGITTNLNLGMNFISFSFLVSTYSTVISGMNFINQASSSGSQSSTINSSINSTNSSSNSSASTIPSYITSSLQSPLVTDSSNTYRVDLMNTSFYIPTVTDVVSNDVIRILGQQSNEYIQPDSMSGFVVSLNFSRDTSNILFRGILNQIQVVLPKLIPLPYPTYNGLYSCMSLKSELQIPVQSCSLLNENSTHILCSCRNLADVSLISGRAINHSLNNTFPLICSIEGTQEVVPLQYQFLLTNLSNYSSGVCVQAPGYFANWTGVGPGIVLVFLVLYCIGAAIIGYTDSYERAQIKKLKPADFEAGETGMCRYTEIFTLSPCYSILFVYKAAGTSRMLRWSLLTYLWANIFGWGFAYNDGLSYLFFIPFWIKNILGLVTAWVFYYVTICAANYLQKRSAQKAKVKFQANSFVLLSIVGITFIGWSLYVILRVSILDVTSVYKQVASAVILSVIDAVVFDLFTILVGRTCEKTINYFSLRGFYKFPFKERESNSLGGDVTERTALQANRTQPADKSSTLPSKIFFTASARETFEGPLGPLRGTVVATCLASLNTSAIETTELYLKEGRSRSIPSLNPGTENSPQKKKANKSPPDYPNTTFGSAKKLQLPKIERRQDFYQPRSEMNRQYGIFSKAPRASNLNIAGKDAPNPSKYHLKDKLVHRVASCFSFGQSYKIYSKVTVPDVQIQHLPSETPGPGNYNWSKSFGDTKPKYSFGQRIGWSYMPTTLSNPPVNKYKPEDVKLPTKFSEISLGIGEREFTYIPQKRGIPGPASYDPTAQVKARSSSSPKTDRTHASPSHPRTKRYVEKTPGPGTYDIAHQYKKYDWELQHTKALNYKLLRKPVIPDSNEI